MFSPVAFRTQVLNLKCHHQFSVKTMSSDFHFTTKEGRSLLDFLKSAGGVLRYNEIVKAMKGQKVSKSTTNRLLNELSEKGLIFKIEKEGKTFYRLNDFPDDIKLILSATDVMAKESSKEELGIRNPFEVLKQNILTLYPKMDMNKILDLTKAEVETEYEKDPFMQQIIAKFKKMMK